LKTAHQAETGLLKWEVGDRHTRRDRNWLVGKVDRGGCLRVVFDYLEKRGGKRNLPLGLHDESAAEPGCGEFYRRGEKMLSVIGRGKTAGKE